MFHRVRKDLPGYCPAKGDWPEGNPGHQFRRVWNGEGPQDDTLGDWYCRHCGMTIVVTGLAVRNINRSPTGQ